jgi:hypothetical protein
MFAFSFETGDNLNFDLYRHFNILLLCLELRDSGFHATPRIEPRPNNLKVFLNMPTVGYSTFGQGAPVMPSPL